MPTSLQAPPRAGVLVVVLVALVALALPAAPAAHADAGMESQFLAEVNRERSAAGLGALSNAGDLTSVARAHSGVMADANDLHHNPNLGGDVSGWQKVGENVGRGPSVSALHSAFMNSPGHKANILDPDWTQAGVGVVVRDGTIWVTVVFRLPKGAAPEPEPEPEPQPEPEPAPEPEPEPEPAADPASSNGGSDADGSSDPAASDAASEPEPEPEPEPHEVVERPLPLDRVSQFLAREEAAERSLAFEDVLASD